MNNKNINNIIKAKRLEMGLSQEQLAELAEISLRTIQRAEDGVNISGLTKRSIAKAFETEPEDLFSKIVPIAEDIYDKDNEKSEEYITLNAINAASDLINLMSQQRLCIEYDNFESESTINIVQDACKIIEEKFANVPKVASERITFEFELQKDIKTLYKANIQIFGNTRNFTDTSEKEYDDYRDQFFATITRYSVTYIYFANSVNPRIKNEYLKVKPKQESIPYIPDLVIRNYFTKAEYFAF